MYVNTDEIKKLQIAEPIKFEQYLEKIDDFAFHAITGMSRAKAMELVRVEVLKNLKLKQRKGARK